MMTVDAMETPEEFKFSAISEEEERESGDGDSGGESKEMSEFEDVSATSKVDASCADNKAKEQRIKGSKIPVRKAKNKPKQKPETDDDNVFEASTILDDSELDCGDDKLPILEEDVSILEAPEEFRQQHDYSVQDVECRNHASVKSDAPINNNIVLLSDSDELNEELDESKSGVASCAMDAPSGSMGIDAVAEFARASRCRSRVPTVEVSADPPTQYLTWSFRNGRLCFEHDNNEDKICSRDLNRTPQETRSRLKLLELKLKEAGLTVDATVTHEPAEEGEKTEEQVVDQDKEEDFISQEDLISTEFNCEEDSIPKDFVSEDVVSEEDFTSEEDFIAEDLIPESADPICQFSSEAFDHGLLLDSTSTMGIDGDTRSKHNPDRDNLKSLLKRPGKSKDKRGGASNRVVFNENKNEFFDADYIILIREECEYDDEEEDTVCTCNQQHEMVRLQCCEPNCNCTFENGYEQTPQSPKFAPPIEFVDAVTLSPPEGYKDMELEEQQLLALQQMARRGQQQQQRQQQQQQAVCKECSVAHDEHAIDDGEGSQSDNEVCGETNSDRDEDEKEKTDQSQQTTPTTPPNDTSNTGNYSILESMTEQRIKESEEERRSPNVSGSPINGILKGGRLWKQTSFDNNPSRQADLQQESSSVTSDEETTGKRSVRFTESNPPKRDTCDGEEEKPSSKLENSTSTSPESTTEMMLTFKLGNHVLISNNSLKPNSAVRQLFPCTNKLSGKNLEEPPENIQQYLVTAESLRAFEEAKRSKLPQIIQSGETDESIKKAIERNTLRRSLIRYEPRSKKNAQKTDNSLVERIKQLTCDVDEETRASPPGEEANVLHNGTKTIDKSFSPSSSSTASSSASSNSSVSSTYKKITDLFAKGNKGELQPPDLGNGGSHLQEVGEISLVRSNEARKQFLAPLTACVSAVGGQTEDFYFQAGGGERTSLASSVGTEYSLEDIDEGLKNGGDEESKKIAPDVLAGTPSASESGDELAMFVQQDASRIERIKKKYQPDSSKGDDDDEHDDYGFNHRPSVRGIKPRFGTTTEILQQIQNQIQPRVAWPYYSESGLVASAPEKTAPVRNNANQNPVPQYPQPHYRPTSLQDENLYQNCANQRCNVYRINGNQTYSTAVKITPEYYRRSTNGRAQSPPPMDMSKTYHQTMVYIPYNHIEGYQPTYYQSSDFIRVSNHNQINKRYIEPCYQQPEHVYVKPIRIPFGRSESPQFSTARATQTPSSSCNNYYRFRPLMVPAAGTAYPNDCSYVTKPNRHSFPAGHPRFPNPDSISLTDSESSSALNGYRTMEMGFSQKESPTKQRFLERGVPEGAAASVPSQDSTTSSSTMTSPTSPQNPAQSTTTQKPLFYAMNV